MIQSMTGFATQTLILELDSETKINVTISIKSLNSRFFETSCKLPYMLGNFEHDFIKLLKDKLHRGHIYLIIHMSNQNLLKGTIKPANQVIKGYLDAVNKIKKQFKIEGKLSLHDLFQLPEVFNVEEKDLDKTAVEQIFAITQELINEVIQARKKEGMVLHHDIEQRITIMQKEIDAIDKVAQTLMEVRKTRINQELNLLGKNNQEAADIRKQMLYTALDKIDIHEEIIRFKSHLSNLLSLLEAPDIEKGKRIDFTLQELGREINTIAAKCSDVTISSLAINIKVELETARAQTQNVV